MYCRACTYDLGRITSTACPECGRSFDPDDPASYDPVVPSRVRADLVRWGVLALLVITQLGLLLAWRLRVGFPAEMSWIPVALLPVGALAAGWQGHRRAPSVGYGLVGLLVVGGGVTRYEGLLTRLLIHLPPLLNLALALGLVTILIAGSVTASRIGWRLRVRWARLRATAAGARQERRLRRVRQIAVPVVVVLGLAAAWAVVETVRIMYATPTVRVDYHARADALCTEVAGVELETGPYAWTELARILGEAQVILAAAKVASRNRLITPRDPADIGHLDFRRVVRGRRLPPDVAREERAITALADAGLFDRLAALADGPIGIRRRAMTPGPLLFEQPPETHQALELGLVLVASMRIAARDDDLGAVADRFVAAVTLGRVISHQGREVDWLVGSAIVLRAAEELRHELGEAEFPEAVCERLLATLDRPPVAPATLTLDFHRLIFDDLLQQTCTDDGDGDGHFIPIAITRLPCIVGPPPRIFVNFVESFSSRFVGRSRREHREAFETLIDRLTAEVRRPAWIRLREPTTVEWPSGDDLPQHLGPLVGPNLRWAARTDATLLRIDAARTMIAVELFVARHGRLPATLDALVPDILPAVPLDAFSGAPLRYRVRAGADGEPAFLLYSVGTDGQDDGGIPGPDDVREAAMRGPAGLDLLFTLPRNDQP